MELAGGPRQGSNNVDRNIEQYARGTPARAQERGRQQAGAGRSVQDGQMWDGEFLTLDDLEVVVPPGGGPVIGSVAVELSGVRRVRRTAGAPRFVQRRVGWLAQRDRLVMIESHLDLRARPDGKFTRVGRWTQHAVDVLGASALPQRTVGDVRDDALSDFGLEVDARHPSDSEESRDPMLASGRLALSYLPHNVRLGVAQAVPSPEFCIGQAVRHTDGYGAISRHQIQVLALQGRRGVVVMASTQGTSGWWQIEQVTYDLLTRPGTALSGAEQSGEIRR